MLRGREAERARVEAMLRALPDAGVAWVSSEAPERGFVWARPRELGRLLGQGFDAVVLDGRRGIDPDLLGQAHGLVFGGGALILRLRGADDPPDPDALAPLAAHPYTAAEVGRRFEAHLERVLSRHASPGPHALAPADRRTRGTAEQAAIVARLIALWSSAPSRSTLIADRGRGKSSALGLALRQLGDRGERVVTAGSEAAVAEVLRFADESARFVPLLELLDEPDRFAVIVVDEAAQLPVPLLRALVRRHPSAHLAFATTTHGYEGTGRGFSLRFATWLAQRGPVERLELREPIRWADDDPLERAVFEALLLDAEPAALDEELGGEQATRAALAVTRRSTVRLDRDALIANLPRLRELFGLLVHAHYRTTPGDLRRLLDAPNLEVHATMLDGRIVAATLVAEEGTLPEALIDAARSGRTRLRAHALADVLIAHLGRADAGTLRMRRSVRIAVHPQLRRHGLASALVEHVHRSSSPDAWSGCDGSGRAPVDLFGTLFGATPALVEFRRKLGYQLVRVSASRGARTGEPSLLMLRPVSERARQLVGDLRRELARELETQLALLEADEGQALDPELRAALRADLPPAQPYSPHECRAAAEDYAHGPRTFESVATAIRGFAASVDLAVLPPDLRAVVEGRALHLHGWRRVTSDASLPSPAASMRAMRRAIRLLLTSR